MPITLKDVDNAKKKLGVYCSPTGNFTTHVDIIIQTGLLHASCLKGRPIPPRDARKSVDLAIILKILYGGVAVTHPLAQLLKAFHKIYYNLLPQLGINRNITREYRMLPRQYQGLGLPNPNIEILSAKLQLIQEHWDTTTTMGSMLMQAYQVFQMEVGLGGNIFHKLFKSLGHLATHGFFQNLWELLDLFGVSLRIHNIFEIPLLRVDNRMIMDAVVETDIFTAKELDQVNRVRHHKRVTSVADLTCCDGRTIKTDLYSSSAGRSYRNFPRQQPTPGNFVVWKKAIGLLPRPGNKLIKSLGNYILTPHTPNKWFVNNIRTKIYHKTLTGLYEQYALGNPHSTTRYGALYVRCQ